MVIYLVMEKYMKEDIIKRSGYIALGSRLIRVGEQLRAESQKIIDKHDIQIQGYQHFLLVALVENGPLAIGDLAEVVGVSQPGVTRSIGQLKKQGYVEIQLSETDKRMRIVALTPLGHKVYQEAKDVTWPQIDYCLTQLLSGQNGPFMEQLDHLEKALDDGSLIAQLMERRDG